MERTQRKAAARAIGKRVGSRIVAARQAKGWSRARLAREVEVSLTNLNLIERGDVSLTLATLAVIARGLGCSPVDLLGDEPPPKRPAAGKRVFEQVVDRLSRARDDRYLKAVVRMLDALDEVMK